MPFNSVSTMHPHMPPFIRTLLCTQQRFPRTPSHKNQQTRTQILHRPGGKGSETAGLQKLWARQVTATCAGQKHLLRTGSPRRAQAAGERGYHVADVTVSKVTAVRLVSFVQWSYGAIPGVARMFHWAPSITFPGTRRKAVLCLAPSHLPAATLPCKVSCLFIYFLFVCF